MLLFTLLTLACAPEAQPEADTGDFGPALVTLAGACGDADPVPAGNVVAVTICGAPNGIDACRGATWEPQTDGSVYIVDCDSWGDDATWSVLVLR